MKKFFSVIVVLVLVGVFLVACKDGSSNVEEPSISKSFVYAKDGQFMLDGKPFRFAGTNNYYLNYKDEKMIDDVIENAKAMNLEVIRMWAFLDGMEGSMADNNAYMQTKPGVFDEIPEGARNGFEAIDYTLKKAAEEDIKLVLVFTNNWDAFGGVSTYVSWSETATTHDDFYTDPACKEMYKNYVNYLVNRENSLTGIVYKDDPTIFAWELMNEPRAESDKTGDTLVSWVDEMSAYVKSLDPNHMVTVGDEGFFNNPDAGAKNWAYNGYSGVDWKRLIELEHIDYGTFHLYPDHWGETFEEPEKSGTQWILDHAAVAKEVGKPAVLEEYGIVKIGENNREFVYETWTNAAYDSGIAGTMFWILTGIDTGSSADSEGLYPDYDSFRINNDGSRVAKILSNHGLMMKGETIERTPQVYIEAPYITQKVSDVFAFKARMIEYGAKVEAVEFVIGGTVFPASIKGSLVLETYNHPWDGDTEVIVNVTFSDGTVASDKVITNISNKATEIVLKDSFTFDTDLEGFEMDLGTMASVGSLGISHSTAVGDGAIAIDANWSGVADWQEIRVGHMNLPSVGEAIRIEYDLYYDLSLVEVIGGIRPYAVADPGWSKLGLDENDISIDALPVEHINGTDYAVQHVVIPVIGSYGATKLYIGIVGNQLPYKGLIYLDNIQVYVEQFVE